MSERAEGLRRESDDQLRERLVLLRKEQLHLRMRRALSGAYPDSSRLSKARKAVARILTIQGERARRASRQENDDAEA